MADLQIVGGVTWPARKHRCQICADTGVLLDDNDLIVDFCDCETGEAQRAARHLQAVDFCDCETGEAQRAARHLT